MRYNMDFLVAALIFLIVLWHHFMKQRQYAGNKTEKTFQIFMMLGIGDRIRVYRSNMVIPKVHDSIDKSGNFDIPDKCPVCGEPTKIIKENDSEVLWCTSPECKGKLLGNFRALALM